MSGQENVAPDGPPRVGAGAIRKIFARYLLAISVLSHHRQYRRLLDLLGHVDPLSPKHSIQKHH